MKANKVSRKGIKLNFYTEDQVNELLTAIRSQEYKGDRAIARVFAEKFERPVNNVYSKIRFLNGKASYPVYKKKVKVVAKVVEPKVKKVKQTPVAKIEVIEEVKPLTLPKGMTYQGKAKKVELHADHFRVYF